MFSALSNTADGALARLGGGAAVRIVRGCGAQPTACLLIGEAPWPVAAPDGEPTHALWRAHRRGRGSGEGEGAARADALAAVPRTAWPGVGRGLRAAATADQALEALREGERGG